MRLQESAANSGRRGRALLQLDLAAALASDYVRANVADPARSRMAGWIVDMGPNGHEVLFFTRDDPPRAVLKVTFTANGKPLGESIDGIMTPRQRALATVKRTVLSAATKLRAGFHNAVVIPPPHDRLPDAPIEAYLIRAASAPGDVVLGVHWHVLVSADCLRVLEARALSHADLILSGSRGVPPHHIAVTHVLGNTPTEIHVYLSSKHDRPIDVVTTPSNAMWRVCADDIRLLGERL